MDNQKSVQPPFTDRGVENTDTLQTKDFKQVDIVIDWLQVTIQGHPIDEVLKRVFNVSSEICQHTPSGRFGYNNTYTYGEKILVMWHDMRYEMGVHILLSGSACRELEDLMSWQLLFERLITFEVMKITRIDIAIDTYKRYFDIALLRKKISDGELVSKFKKGTYMEQISVSDGTQQSASLKFGSMSSDIYIVFYDKLAERRNAGYTVDDTIDFWVRTELRFKHDLATKLTAKIINNDYKVGDFIYGILYNYLDFKDYDCDDSNKSRWQTSQFWLDFLGTVSKLELANKAQQSTIQRKRHYAECQMSKMLAMLRIVDNDFYDNLFKLGVKKIGKQDLEIINSHFISQNITPIKMDDIVTLYHDIVSHERETAEATSRSNEIHRQLKLDGVL